MNKLEKLVESARRKMIICMQTETSEDYMISHDNYRIATNKLNKLADKIGKTHWNKMLNETNLCNVSYGWTNYRDYMKKQKD